MRIALVGAGRIGAFHAETLCHSSDVGELLIADADSTHAAAVAERLAPAPARPSTPRSPPAPGDGAARPPGPLCQDKSPWNNGS